MKELKAYIILFITIVTIGTLTIIHGGNDNIYHNNEIIFYEIGDF